MAILATCSVMFAKPQSASAQVDMSLLTEVAKSCQKDTTSSAYYEQMGGSFIQWFLNLDKPTRRKVMSILGDNQEAANNRSEVNQEAIRALEEYEAIRRKVAQEEQDRRRREVIGN